MVPCLRLLRKLLRSRNLSQTLVLIIPQKIHPFLVKPLSYMLFSLLQKIRPLTVRRREKVKPKPMPQNRTLLNHLMMMILKESPNVLASSVRRIITPRIVPDVLKLIAY